MKSSCELLLARRQVGTAAMSHFRRHANAFAQRGVRVDGFADVDGIRAHLNGQRHFTDHVARVGADHAATQNLAVAERFWGLLCVFGLWGLPHCAKSWI